jgi:hypothetical protein
MGLRETHVFVLFLRTVPGFPAGFDGIANFMRLSAKKAAHVGIGECRVAGNPARHPLGWPVNLIALCA